MTATKKKTSSAIETLIRHRLRSKAKIVTVEPRFNEPLYSEVLGITKNIFQPTNSVMYGKETRCNEPSI